MAKTESPKLNNGQRKAIAANKTEQMDKLLQRAHVELDDQKKRAEAEVRGAYGVDKKLDMIRRLERQIMDIKDSIDELGFHSRGPYFGAKSGSEAAEMIATKTEPYRQRRAELFRMRASIIQECWTAQTVDDIPEIPDIPEAAEADEE